MKVSLNWLKEYIQTDCSADQLAEMLTMAGIEVEETRPCPPTIPKGVLVAEILKREPHPNADKLSVCQVETGSGKVQVVCGAPNCDPGLKAPLATVGTSLNDHRTGRSTTISDANIRGTASKGMLCSSRDIGIDDCHDGIMILPKHLAVGTPICKFLVPDTVFDVEITPNRPDCLSHWGIARDIAALTNTKPRFPDFKTTRPKTKDSKTIVKVKNPALCPRYNAKVIRGVKVSESPEWLKTKLSAIGLRPINNIVDITNFVMMELGHPLHAFDLDLLEGKTIVVRNAAPGESIQTLDGNSLKLNESNLMICDTRNPVALAGIMGGENSGVTEATRDILLESAVFNPSNIRATARALKISSDSSFRFERGVDWNMSETASDRAASLILELAGGNLSEAADIKTTPPKLHMFECRFDKIRDTLGIKIGDQDIVSILQSLGLDVENISDKKCTITSNSYRMDIAREADIAEEVARIHGLHKIPPSPMGAQSASSIISDSYIKLQNFRDHLIGIGFNECINYTMTQSERAAADARFANDDLIRVSNPISVDMGYLRPSLLSNMLDTVERNVSRQNHDLKLFEIGRVFCANLRIFPEERTECCIAITGRKHPERFSEEKKINFDFFDIKGVMETLLNIYKISEDNQDVEFKKLDQDAAMDNFAPGCACSLSVAGEQVAVLGKTATRLTKGIRLTNPLFIAMLNLDFFCSRKKDEAPDGSKTTRFKPITPYPSTTRDVAFIADATMQHASVMRTIRDAKAKDIEKIEIFDIFTDDSTIGKGKKSMAYSITFRNPERTLTDKEVNEAHEKIRAKLAKKLPVELR